MCMNENEIDGRDYTYSELGRLMRVLEKFR